MNKKNIHLPRCRGNELKNAFFATSVLSLLLVEPSFLYAGEKGKATGNETAKHPYQPFQQRRIKGRVVDTEGAPLSGVSVTVKGTGTGVSTAADGTFEITLTGNQAILVFSSVGKKEQEVRVGDQTELTVVLANDENTKLSDVVIVAFGSQKKQTVTSSITQVDTKVLQDRPVNNLTSALQGQVAGLNIKSTSGQPGANPSINIRGVGSLQSGTSPLVIIDGIPGSLNLVNPNDVESISVLKDASASSLYGARAANGVILVVTKKGKLGRATVSYSGYVGKQTPTELFQEADAYNYANAYNTALMYDAITRANPAFDENKKVFTAQQLEGWKSGAVPGTNWRKELFGANDFTQSHNVNISGGLSREGVSIRNNAAFGYLGQKGNVVHTKFDRVSVRDNAGIKWNRFNLDLNLALTYTNKTEPTSAAVGNFGAIISAINRQRPVDPIRNADGEWNITATNDTRNPVRQAAEGGTANTKQYNLVANIGLGFDITKDLTLKFTNGVNYLSTNEDAFKNSLVWYNGTETGPNSSTKADYSTVHYLQQLDLTYKKSVGDHNLTAIVGGQQEYERYKYLMGYRQGFINNSSGSLQLGSATGLNNSSVYYDWGIMGVFGRINYDYKRRYLLELNAREDGSSRLSPGKNWGFFPSASVGWRISEEDFMQPVKATISELKLRSSYGVLGNQNIPGADNNALYYPYQSIVGAANDPSYWGPLYYVFGGVLVNPMTIVQDPNNTFTWERTSILDVAVEGALFRNAVNFSIGYFDKTTRGMLMTKKVSSVNGAKDYVANIGEMSNHGVEIELGYHKTTKERISYNFNGNFTYMTNKLLDLGGIDLAASGVNRNVVGKPLNAYYLYVNDGLLSKKEFLDPGYKLLNGQKYGDQKIKDQNNDGIINASDKVMTDKTSTPKWFYGLNFDVSYKGLGLAGMFQGAAGNYLYLGASTGYGFSSGYSITNWTVQNSYNPLVEESNYNTRLPRTSVSNSINSTYPSNLFLFNASYVRLKNLRVYYTFPESISRKIGMSNARVFVSGQNLYTISKLPKALGIDPEVSSPTAGYPLVKIYTFGIDVTF